MAFIFCMGTALRTPTWSSASCLASRASSRRMVMSASPPPRASGTGPRDTEPIGRPLAGVSVDKGGIGDNEASANVTGAYTLDADGYELDPEALKEKAMGVVNDVSTRPWFYGKIVAYALGGLVTVTVLKAVVTAVDSIPVLPGGLELIGLGYTVWFVWRYILFKESREELLEEIEEFLGRAKPGGQ